MALDPRTRIDAAPLDGISTRGAQPVASPSETPRRSMRVSMSSVPSRRSLVVSASPATPATSPSSETVIERWRVASGCDRW
ncbi:hypothetical protein B5808_18025 [Cnuibacter physcomitrellae]|uniref:Uncharacterized protein n=1 Tax=Cnuibacter physcomitrellae TaxID=1619308 RepID=A0A1X9LUH5_9MICO|nr:hypothetical protein B5808_18025 [Cnuibacter physcomitrellae]